MMSRKKNAWAILCAFCLVAPVRADGWVELGREDGRVIELNTDTAVDAQDGVRVAWARMLLPEAQVAQAGYVSVHALNRYDCREATVQTVRRRYFDERQQVVRVEEIVEPRAVLVGSGMDRRLWDRVCDDSVETAPDTAQTVDPEVSRIADDAERIAQVLGSLRSGQTRIEKDETVVETRASATSRPSPRQAPDPVPEPAPQPPQKQGPSRDGSGPDWSYSGVTGPEHWGDLRPEWSQCRQGRRQSPIDVDDGLGVDLEPVDFRYGPAYYRVEDTGRNLRIMIGPGQMAEIRGQRYELEHIDVHRPAQQHVAGQAHDLSLSMQHRSDDGALAVVTLLVNAAERAQPVIQSWLNNLPLERGGDYAPDKPVDLSVLLPESPAHYLYMGSLTRPPCTEGVVQVVMQQPLSMSWDQFRIIARLHPPNSRPLQPRNDRLILQSR